MSKAGIMAISADIYYWAMNGPIIKVFQIKITNEIRGVACNNVDSLRIVKAIALPFVFPVS